MIWVFVILLMLVAWLTAASCHGLSAGSYERLVSLGPQSAYTAALSRRPGVTA